jgi:hypothetical protein
MSTDEIRRQIEQALEMQKRLGLPQGSQLSPQVFTSSHMRVSDTAELIRAAHEGVNRQMFGGTIREMEVPQSVQIHGRLIKQVEDQLGDLRRWNEPFRAMPSGLGAAVAAISAHEKFRLPEAFELGEMARTVMAASSLASTVLETQEHLQRTLGGMHTPWAQLNEGLVSARALSDIIAMGAGISRFGGFDRRFASALRPLLGDWRDAHMPEISELLDPMQRSSFYIEQGLDPNLTTFTSEAFDEGMRVSGLWYTGADEDHDEGLGVDENEDLRAEQAFSMLRHFEVEVRLFIQRAMEAHFGEQWMKRQIPSEMLAAWKEKREKAINSGQAPGQLIDFADFSDYKMIIERGDNWGKVFKPVFGRKEDVQESFLRLQPVRIATMHSRVVTKEDQLLLLVEAKRVLFAIKRS